MEERESAKEEVYNMNWDKGFIQSLKEVAYPPKLYHYNKISKSIEGGFGNVTDTDLQFFHDHGYLVVHDAFDQSDIELAQQSIYDLIDGKYPDFKGVQIEPKLHKYLAELSGLEKRKAARKIHGFVDCDSHLNSMFYNQDLLQVLARFMDDEPLHLQDMALLKPSDFGSEKPWHQDCAYFNYPLGTTVIGVWIALDQATSENGCMHIAPGSHKEPMIHFKRRDWQICDTDVSGENDTLVPLEPGGCLFFHGLMHHGTPANFSRSQRRALQFHYRPACADTITTEARLEIFGSEGTNAEC